MREFELADRNDQHHQLPMPILPQIDRETPVHHTDVIEGQSLRRSISDSRKRRVLFVQATNPGAYPPLIHASMLMAEAGWEVTFLSAPIAGNTLSLAPHPRIKIHAVRTRPSHVMSNVGYALYATTAARLSLQLRPDVVYASDPLGAGPGLLAARLAGAALVYHEHDSPQPGMLRPILGRLRAAAARSARLIIFPNEGRARFAQSELRFSDNRLHIVWNVPRRAELASSAAPAEPPLIVYYHGSITPERLPETVALAVRRLTGRVRLRIAGYEAPSAGGYVRHLVGSDAGAVADSPVEYLGMVSRADLLMQAAHAHVGLALMPCQSSDLNMRYMTGASNKPFDYMAAGLALLVSDLPDWTRIFVKPGFARAADPTNLDSLTAALEWFANHPSQRKAMAARARAKIESDWNYDTAFAPIIGMLTDV
jgi:glycosyltransferase involved in cell wall biosynthesis